MKYLLSFFVVCLIVSCQPKQEKPITITTPKNNEYSKLISRNQALDMKYKDAEICNKHKRLRNLAHTYLNIVRDKYCHYETVDNKLFAINRLFVKLTGNNLAIDCGSAGIFYDAKAYQYDSLYYTQWFKYELCTISNEGYYLNFVDSLMKTESFRKSDQRVHPCE